MSVRVRFAPSPTGGLHLGGVRTVLYNYLFAKRHGGQFILRIEDTDQSRYVPGAEEYILQCLAWCGLQPDEGVQQGGDYGPYRQSERKAIYRKYAEQLVESGYAYYAFDTPEELEQMRETLKTPQNPSPQYGAATRGQMRNSLTLEAAVVAGLLAGGTPHVIRIKMPEGETVSFTDAIRGEVSFSTDTVDDKVLMKADGMPTYHLAVVVDDYLMKITNAFRGEEWLPSAPVHILLWKYLGWEAQMPQWAHLPLIMGPDGAKLSKRHGNKYGFPIFAQSWTDPKTGDFTEGFKERGFLPEAFINILAMLGWNDGSGQEIFSMDELIARFDLSRVAHSGAIFDFEKAKWFNAQYIQQKSAEELVPLVRPFLQEAASAVTDEKLAGIIALIKERCMLLTDFREQGGFFFEAPAEYDLSSIRPKWTAEKTGFFRQLTAQWSATPEADAASLEAAFTALATECGIKKGELMLPLRIMLVGGKFGPGVFDIAVQIGLAEVASRVARCLELLAV